MHLFLIVSLLFAAACQSEKRRADYLNPADPVIRLDEARYFAEPCRRKDLTVWPILADKTVDPGEFLSLKEAQDRGLAVVREVGAGAPEAGPEETGAAGGSALSPAAPAVESATVNQLVIENNGSLPILVCGGTVVKGGNQDRQIARDFVIAPRTKTPVDVFCVEKGRWEGSREGAPTLALFSAEEVVTTGNVSFSAGYESNQAEVWKAVDAVNLCAGKDPPSGTLLATLEDPDPDVAGPREETQKAIREHFQELRRAGRSPVGFAYAVDGRPVMVRTFASPRLFESQFEAFLKSMSIESELAHSRPELALRSAPAIEEERSAGPASLKDVLEMVRSIDQATEEISSTPAANKHGLRRCEKGGNLNCYLERPLPRCEGAPQDHPSLLPVSQEWTAAPLTASSPEEAGAARPR